MNAGALLGCGACVSYPGHVNVGDGGAPAGGGGGGSNQGGIGGDAGVWELATANLAGRTLRDLVLGEATTLTGLPWVGRTARSWEPEPLRWIGAHTVYALYRAADRREARGLSQTSRLATVADRLANLLDRLEPALTRASPTHLLRFDSPERHYRPPHRRATVLLDGPQRGD